MTNPRHQLNPTLNLFNARDVEQIERWIKEGADVNGRNEKGNTPLMNAARKGWVEAVDCLLKRGALVSPVNDRGVGVNIMASRGDSKEVFELLMKAGMDPFLRDEHNRTGLMLATQPDIARMLVKAGLSVHEVSEDGRGVVHHIVSDKQRYLLPNSVEVLVSLGADLDLQNNAGETPLMHSLNQNIMMDLLHLGADASCQDHEQNNILHVIANHQLIISSDVVEMALKCGADPYLKNKRGETAMDIFNEKKSKLYPFHHAHETIDKSINVLQCVWLNRATPQAPAQRKVGPRL